ncbi:MAG: hypothetical protein U9N49_10415 [Campylobacterota bacterium]|nr:hypothetical protein [Campylobacterota bacterium]
MATHEEYEVLNECYYSAMATFDRLSLEYQIPKENYQEDQVRYQKIWTTQIKMRPLEEINYDETIEEMNHIIIAWEQKLDELFSTM